MWPSRSKCVECQVLEITGPNTLRVKLLEEKKKITNTYTFVLRIKGSGYPPSDTPESHDTQKALEKLVAEGYIQVKNLKMDPRCYTTLEGTVYKYKNTKAIHTINLLNYMKSFGMYKLENHLSQTEK
jgi:hypothetical protein